MNWVEAILNYSAFDVDVVRWSLVLMIVLGSVLLFSMIKHLVAGWLDTLARRSKLKWLRHLVSVFRKPAIFLFLAIGLFVGLTALEVHDRFESLGFVAARVFMLMQVGVWLSAAASVGAERYRCEIENEPAQRTALSAAIFVLKLIVWSVIFLMVLANMGFDITALVASLGIGGIALALAAQNILGDLFAFFSIIIDKPFVEGDFIIVGDFLGTIEHIGIKTTRVRSLGGEQLIFSNQDLLQSRIRNFKRMQQRRVVFEFGVVYDTSTDHVAQIPEMVRGFIEQEEEVRFDRAHFKEFGDSSLRFEVVYWVLSADFNVYMDIHQRIIFAMLEEFRTRGIDFAFPTRTVHYGGGGGGNQWRESA